MKAHLIMPMAGAGSRFRKEGYSQPKPLIEIAGRPFFFWATQSICGYVDLADITFVVLEEHVRNYAIDEAVKKYYPNARVKVLDRVLDGPVFTAMEGASGIDDGAPVLFNDCDHMFLCQAANELLNAGDYGADGFLLTFESNNPQFSYARLSDDGNVLGTVEKKVVSNHAICGAYGFRDVSAFLSAAKEYVDDCPYDECFMSGVYNVMVSHGMRVRDCLVDWHVEFGTPGEYAVAKTSSHFGEVPLVQRGQK